MDRTLINKLKKAFEAPLPGKKAQSLMAPVERDAYYQVPESHKIACVLALLFPINSIWHIAFIERNHHIKDKHSGQVSFPGGGLKSSDPDYQYCALRETEEEIGVPQKEVKILGKLSKLYVFVSNYVVHPFVGYCKNEPDFFPQESEVKNILKIPLTHFSLGRNKSVKDIMVRNMILADVPFYDLDGFDLWGATAMMMSELNEIIDSFNKT